MDPGTETRWGCQSNQYPLGNCAVQLKGIDMSEQAKALGALLITISDLCDDAEAHGIIQNPPAAVLGPLIEDASHLGIALDAAPTLAELHLAVEAAAQQSGGERAGSGLPGGAVDASQR